MRRDLLGEEGAKGGEDEVVIRVPNRRRLGGVGGVGGGPGGEAEPGIGLLAASSALVEDGAVDAGDDDVVAAAEIKGGGIGTSKRRQLRLREEPEIHHRDRLRRHSGDQGRFPNSKNKMRTLHSITFIFFLFRGPFRKIFS